MAVLAGGALGIYIYKDEIIDLLKDEVNKTLKTELEVDNIDVNLVKGFPNLTVDFKGVRFHSAFDNEMLLEGDHVFFMLNIMDLLKKDIVIQQLEINNSKLIIHRNKRGQNNYDVFREANASDSTSGSLDIKSVKLTNMEVVHKDETKDINAAYAIDHLLGSAQFDESIIEFYVQSTFTLKEARMKNVKWLIGKKIMITTRVLYDGKSLSVPPSDLAINKAHFKFNGDVGLGEVPSLLIEISGEDTNFSDLVSILPSNIREKLAPYNGEGTIDFRTNIDGKVLPNSWPKLTARIDLTDFRINHKQLKEQLYINNASGELTIGDLMKPGSAHFNLKNAVASVNDKQIKISGSINDFDVPAIKGKIKGDLDVPWLLSVSNIELDQPANGYIAADLNFDFKLVPKGDRWEMDDSKAEGMFNLHNVSFHIHKHPEVKEVSGSVSWTYSGLEIKDLNGGFGESDILINGRIDHFLELFDPTSDAPVLASLNAKGHYVDLDEVVGFITQLPSNSTASRKNIDFSRYLFKLDLFIDTVHFRRFEGTNLKTSMQIEHNRILVDKLTSAGLGGQVAVAGKIVKQFNEDIYIEANIRTNTIELDSLFYVFDNFQQDFITDSYLKGKLNANIFTSMYFDDDWRFKRKLLYAEALLQIKKGELNDFEPIMALSPYLNNSEEKLSRLRFSDLNSHVDISNDTVYISDMYVGTNVRNIKIGGYHTLDQHIDYRLSVPVINDNKDKDSDFGKIKKDKEGRLYWPFRIKGTTDDYKVNYDLGRAGSNIVKGFKREVTELGNTLIGKSKKETKIDSLTLEDDEFFDWDDN